MEIIIAVDAMGADAGPAVAVEGAVLALSDPGITKILLIGPQDELGPLLAGFTYDKARLEVVSDTEVIGVDEAPTAAIKAKKDSSIVVGLGLVRAGQAGAFVSAGSTGALLAGATLLLGRIKGIKRPALGVMLPNTTKGHTFLIDAGANVDAKPEYLLQFAQMGSVYVQTAMGIERPRVGLINVGAEKEKGNNLTKAAYELLENADELNFIGNIEGREISAGAADVAVCDAFVGNIVLKYAEGYAKGIFAMLKEELMAGTLSKIGAALSRGAFGRLRKRFDYQEIGGAPFIGLKGLVVKAHGSSNAKAFKSSIGQCAKFIQADVVNKIQKMSSEAE
jgi:glycerol-3-phosphate acyltransferase PlsX